MREILKTKLHWSDLITIGGLIAILGLIYYGYLAGVFDSRDSFAAFIKSFGPAAILVFVLIQIIQVILPILPAALTCSAGVIVFGPYLGLVYNYIGIVLGSIGAFVIAKHYGQPLVRKMISEQNFDKYYAMIKERKTFDRFFAIAIFAPIAPDDVLCYIAGLTGMSLKKFTVIILLGKPLSIALYSLGWATLIEWLNVF